MNFYLKFLGKLEFISILNHFRIYTYSQSFILYSGHYVLNLLLQIILLFQRCSHSRDTGWCWFRDELCKFSQKEFKFFLIILLNKLNNLFICALKDKSRLFFDDFNLISFSLFLDSQIINFEFSLIFLIQILIRLIIKQKIIINSSNNLADLPFRSDCADISENLEFLLHQTMRARTLISHGEFL